MPLDIQVNIRSTSNASVQCELLTSTPVKRARVANATTKHKRHSQYRPSSSRSQSTKDRALLMQLSTSHAASQLGIPALDQL